MVEVNELGPKSFLNSVQFISVIMSLLISLKINDLTSFRLLSVNSQETNIRAF